MTPNGLELVNTVFGPFLRDPTEAIARQLREAISQMVIGPGYCVIHGESEDGPAYTMCFECGHVFPTGDAMVADYRQALEGMGRHGRAHHRLPALRARPVGRVSPYSPDPFSIRSAVP